jgi:hypothetical protein
MKSSDLTLSIIIIFLFLLLYLVNFFVVSIQEIKDNWPLYRCNLTVMPFASIFGHDAKENFGYCIANMQKNFMSNFLAPLNFNVNVLGDVAGGLTKNIDDVRKFMDYFRVSVFDTFLNIFSAVFNIIIEMQKTFIKLKDTIGKIVGIMASTLYMLNGSIMTMESVWNGPPGMLIRALCFHPETKLKLHTGEFVEMKNIKLNSQLQNGTRVCSVMQISNLDEHGNYIEKMFKVKRKRNSKKKGKAEGKDQEDDDILVSGSHLIYDPALKQFIHVEDLPIAEVSDIKCEVLYCLITSDHTIPIGGWIFHDWEDSNGTPSKKIGK